MSKVESLNEFIIDLDTNPKDIIFQSQSIFSADKEDKEKNIHLYAIGIRAISRLLVIAELLKSMIPGLSIEKVFSVVYSNPIKKGKIADNAPERIFPKLEIILSPDGKESQKDTSSNITLDERTLLIDVLGGIKESRKNRRAANGKAWRNYYRRWWTYSGRNGYSNPYRRRPFGKIRNGLVWKGGRNWSNKRNMNTLVNKNGICALNIIPNTLNKNSDCAN
jgi:hypothetical protein